MKKTGSGVLGILFIFIGLILIFKQYHFWDFYFLKSYGLFIVGILLFVQGIILKPRRRIYLSTILILIGLFYILSDFDLFYTSRRLLLPVYIIILGLGFYPLFLFQNKRWDFLLAGNVILLIGIIFLFWHLELINHLFLINLANNYWPLILIIFGIIFLVSSFYKINRKVNPGSNK